MKKTNLECFFKNEVLIQMPRKKAVRLLILKGLIEQLDDKKVYSEQEINEFLKVRCEDFVEMRRYLIDFQLLARTKDGTTYRKCCHEN